MIEKRIWFIRHGESEANAGLRTANAVDIALTSKGQKQAVRLVNTLPIDALPCYPDIIVTSPFLRTKQTAEPYLADVNHVTDLHVVEEWPVQEFTYLGRCNDTTMEERKPRAQEYWDRSDPLYCDDTADPLVESFSGFRDRIVTIWQRCIDRKDQKKNQHEAMIIFSHGHVMRAIVWFIMLGQDASKESMCGFNVFRNTVPVLNTAKLIVTINDKLTSFSGFIHNHIPDDLKSV